MLSRLNLSSPSPHPFRQPIRLAYFSVTACQCGWFFVLVPSFVCLLTAKFCSCVFPYRWRGRLLLFLPLLPLLSHAEHTQHYSRCALTHAALSSIFPSRSLQMFLYFYFFLFPFRQDTFGSILSLSQAPKMTSPGETDGGKVGDRQTSQESKRERQSFFLNRSGGLMLLWPLIVSITGGFHALHLAHWIGCLFPCCGQRSQLLDFISFLSFFFFVLPLLQVHVRHSLEKNKRKSQSKG